MNKELIQAMMLAVLDEPTAIRIIVKTCYPDFNNNLDNEISDAYFMIDRGECPNFVYDEDMNPKKDENGNHIYADSEVYDHWRVSDSIGQVRDFKTNTDLMDFLESIEKIIEDAYVESF